MLQVLFDFLMEFAQVLARFCLRRGGLWCAECVVFVFAFSFLGQVAPISGVRSSPCFGASCALHVALP